VLSPSNGPLELRRLGISPSLSALVGTLQQLPRRPMATEARDLYAMLQAVFAQGPVRTPRLSDTPPPPAAQGSGGCTKLEALGAG